MRRLGMLAVWVPCVLWHLMHSISYVTLCSNRSNTLPSGGILSLYSAHSQLCLPLQLRCNRYFTPNDLPTQLELLLLPIVRIFLDLPWQRGTDCSQGQEDTLTPTRTTDGWRQANTSISLRTC